MFSLGSWLGKQNFLLMSFDAASASMFKLSLNWYDSSRYAKSYSPSHTSCVTLSIGSGEGVGTSRSGVVSSHFGALFALGGLLLPSLV
jgi:hypothetical protein